MKLTDFARHLPEEVWQLFESLLPPWSGVGMAAFSESLRLLACRLLRPGQWYRAADAPHRFPLLQNGPTLL
ncbi:MAG TPA: hypothetical protein VES89_12000 [Candidatus Competibacteraceae bacterium]|nr:hypothetical protein [Candidatus Competibacteraceae bacterium]